MQWLSVSFPSEAFGFVADSVRSILRTLSATKPRTSDWKPIYDEISVPICQTLYLVEDDRVGYLLSESLRRGEVALGGVVLDDGRPHDLGPERPQSEDLLRRHVLRQHDDAAVALHGRRDGHADS